MYTFIFLSVFFLGLLCPYLSFLLDGNEDNREKMGRFLRSGASGATISQGFVGKDAKTGIALDEKNKKIILVDKIEEHFTSRVISYSDVLSSEIVEDGESVTKTTRSSQLGGALVGGLLLGGLGAVVGGLSGSKTSGKGKVMKLELHIIVNDMRQPLHVISFLRQEVKRSGYGGVVYDEALNKARHWHSLFNVLLKQVENNQQTKEGAEA